MSVTEHTGGAVLFEDQRAIEILLAWKFALPEYKHLETSQRVTLAKRETNMTNDLIDVDFVRRDELAKAEFDQIRPRQNKTIRVALLTEYCKAKGANYHWYKGKGYRCNSPKDGPDAECCQHVQRSWSCWVLALQYLNADSNGKLARGAEIKYRVGYIALARTPYGQVAECENEAPGCDMFYSNEGHDLISGASSKPIWKNSPQRESVIADAMRLADKLSEKVYPKLTDAEWHRLIKTGTTSELEEQE